jgi:hypothetical protein
MDSVLMLDANLEQRVIRFIAAKTGLEPNAITSASRLLHDLKIDGDDAEELLTEYSHAFQVDMTAFDFHRHFRSEPNLVALWLGNLKRFAPVTVAELVQSARNGSWRADSSPLLS